MEGPLAVLVIAFIVLAAVAIAGYFILRAIFMRIADRMAHHIHRVLLQLARSTATAQVGRAGGAAARAALGHVTRFGAYAAAEGLSEEAARAEFARSIERTARIMDSAITLPVIGGIGLDALLGLFPVAGDTVSALVSVRLIAKSLRYGVPADIITKMLSNVLVDFLLGSIPVAGDLVDIWFKSNERNVILLKEYLGDDARDVIDVPSQGAS